MFHFPFFDRGGCGRVKVVTLSLLALFPNFVIDFGQIWCNSLWSGESWPCCVFSCFAGNWAVLGSWSPDCTIVVFDLKDGPAWTLSGPVRDTLHIAQCLYRAVPFRNSILALFAIFSSGIARVSLIAPFVQGHRTSRAHARGRGIAPNLIIVRHPEPHSTGCGVSLR